MLVDDFYADYDIAYFSIHFIIKKIIDAVI